MVPTVAIVNHATLKLPFDLGGLVTALQEYVAVYLAPVWDCMANVVLAGQTAPAHAWPLVIADNSDIAGALGYHEVARRQPCGFAFAKTTLDVGEDLATTISHELAEMLVDPWTRLTFRGPRGSYYAGEIADAVESYSFAVQGLQMSDFQHPAWFGLVNPDGSKTLDHLGKCLSPYQVLPGGYVSIWSPGTGWHELYGDHAAARHLGRKGPFSRLHRRKRLHRAA